MVDVLMYTAGQGGDYRITASSVKLRPREEEIVEKKALFRGVMPFEFKLKSALRVFNLGDRKAISYITTGVDEFGRPNRLRAHVLLLKLDEYAQILDPRGLKEYFLAEDLFGKLQPIEADMDSVLKRARLEKASAIRRVMRFLAGSEETVKKVLYSVFAGGQAFIIGTLGLEASDIFSKAPNTLDFIVALLAALPKEIVKRLEYSTVTFSFEDEVHVAFFLGPLQEDKSVVCPEARKFLPDRLRELSEVYGELITRGKWKELEELNRFADAVLIWMRKLGNKYKLFLKCFEEVFKKWQF